MNLILQAIKALFRKVENAIAKNTSTLAPLPAQVTAAQSAADAAQVTADNAQSAADTAQATADGKMDAADPVGAGSFSMNRLTGSTVGDYSHAEGYNAEASGNYSRAEGYCTTADIGYVSVGGKFNKKREGDYGHLSKASKKQSPYNSTFGRRITDYTFDPQTGCFVLNGLGSYVSVQNVTAGGIYSDTTVTAEGETYYAAEVYEVTKASGSKATGYIIEFVKHTAGPAEQCPGKYAHIVGNGTSDTDRSNAHTLDWDGVPWYQGRPQFGGTAQDNGAQTVMANGDAEIILKSSTADSTKQFKITVDDTGAITAAEVTE